MTRFVPGDPTAELLREMIDRAEQGDAEAGLELVESIITELYQCDSDLLHWHAQKLTEITQGVPAARALCIESTKIKGRPATWESIRIIAIDQLLRRFADMTRREAAETIEQRFNLDDRTLRGYRKEFGEKSADKSSSALAHCSQRQLVAAAGDYLQKVEDILKS